MPSHRAEPGAGPPAPSAPTYRTGTAARLAGIPVATLRVWERRYDVVGPSTSPSGHRRYTSEDVGRLALIKQLVDLGHPIGAIAHLPQATLLELRRGPGQARERVAASANRTRAALVGEMLAAQAQTRAAGPLDIVASCAKREQAVAALRGARVDLLAVDLQALREDAAAFVGALAAQVGALRVVVAYRFGTQTAVRALRERGCLVVRAPLELSELESLAAFASELPDIEPLARAPAPRFDDAALAMLSTTSSGMYCECPRHVIELLRGLGAFERYSAECEHRSPSDAELHRYLERVAGTARTLFEEALARLAQAEGFALPNGADEAGAQGRASP